MVQQSFQPAEQQCVCEFNRLGIFSEINHETVRLAFYIMMRSRKQFREHWGLNRLDHNRYVRSKCGLGLEVTFPRLTFKNITGLCQ